MRNGLYHSGVVDQYFKATKGLNRGIHSRRYLSIAGHIARDGDGLFADLSRQLRHRVLRTCQQGDIRPCGSKDPRRLSPDPAAGARDHHCLPGHIHLENPPDTPFGVLHLVSVMW